MDSSANQAINKILSLAHNKKISAIDAVELIMQLASEKELEVSLSSEEKKCKPLQGAEQNSKEELVRGTWQNLLATLEEKEIPTNALMQKNVVLTNFSDYFSLRILQFLKLLEHNICSKKELTRHFQIQNASLPFFEEVLALLEKEGWLFSEGDTIHFCGKKDVVETKKDIAALGSRTGFLERTVPEMIGLLKLFEQSLDHLPLILTGELDAKTFLFSEKLENIIWKAYQGGDRISQKLNEVISQTFLCYLEQESSSRLRILEYGFGPIDISTSLLERISLSHSIEFCWEETSSILRELRKKWYQHKFPSLQLEGYRKGELLEKQKEHSFDIILLKTDFSKPTLLKKQLSQLKPFLKQGGIVFCFESFSLNYWKLTFGLIEDENEFNPFHSKLQSSPSNENLEAIFKQESFAFKEIITQRFVLACSVEKTSEVVLKPSVLAEIDRLDGFETLEIELTSYFTTLLGLEAKELDVNTFLTSYGLSSLMLIRAFLWLKDNYSIEIAPPEITDNITIKELSLLIHGKLKKKNQKQKEEPSLVKKELDLEETKSQRNLFSPPSSGSILEPVLKADFEPIHTKVFKTQIFKASSGREYECNIIGDGEPIFFVAGLAFTHRVWEFQIESFSSQYQMIFVHLPGHGKSHCHEKAFTFQDIIEDFSEIVQQLNLLFIHFVGWCLGGNIGQLFAYYYPEKVKSLTLICTTHTDARVRGLNAEDLEAYSNDPLEGYEFEVQNIFQSLPFKDSFSKIYLELIKESYCSISSGVALNYIEELFEFDSSAFLKHIKCPTYVMAGRQDIGFPPKQVKKLEQQINLARFQEFEHSGHMPFLTEFNLFNFLLKEFLAKASLHIQGRNVPGDHLETNQRFSFSKGRLNPF